MTPPMERRLRTTDPAATRALAERLAAAALPGDVIVLVGELGAGKTQFAKGFARGLGIDDVVNSPTFILMAEYAGRLPLFHLDLYRLEGPADALAGGLVDERQATGVMLAEWGERLDGLLPADRLEVHLEGTGEAPRAIRVVALGPHHARYLRALAEVAA